MPDPTILITAGEPSGDRLGGALMEQLKKLHPNVVFIGVGGPEMIGQGLKSTFPMSDLSVMGLVEVIPAIPRIKKRLLELTELARGTKPTLVITIDSQDFSTRLATKLKPLGIPHIHYVAPKVWAWRQHRVFKLKTLYTYLLTILPFEEEFFGQAGIPTTYVGHPAVTTLAPYTLKPSTPQPLNPVLALLPGSRRAELTRHWPLFLQTYRSLRQVIPNLTATLALPDEKALHTCQSLSPWTLQDAITPVFGESRFAALATATAALSKSGTNNLELALLGTPAVVTYRMNRLSHFLARYLIKVPFISLPNLILHYAGQKPVYPELIQHAATLQSLSAALTPLLLGQPAAHIQRQALATFHKLMSTPKPPAQQAAQVISKYI